MTRSDVLEKAGIRSDNNKRGDIRRVVDECEARELCPCSSKEAFRDLCLPLQCDKGVSFMYIGMYVILTDHN